MVLQSKSSQRSPVDLPPRTVAIPHFVGLDVVAENNVAGLKAGQALLCLLQRLRLAKARRAGILSSRNVISLSRDSNWSVA